MDEREEGRITVKAVQDPVAIRVAIKRAATAHSRLDLSRIQRALIEAIQEAVSVRVDVRHIAAAHALTPEH